MSVGKGSLQRVTGKAAPKKAAQGEPKTENTAKTAAAKAPAKKPAAQAAKKSTPKSTVRKPSVKTAEPTLHTPAAPLLKKQKGIIAIGEKMPVWFL